MDDLREWVPIDVDLFRKPGFILAAKAMEASRFEAAGRILAVWCWVQSYGSRTALDASDVEEAAGVPSGTVAALIAARWARREADNSILFGWPGRTLADLRAVRSAAGRRGNAARWNGRATGDRKPIANASQAVSQTDPIRSQSKSKTESKREINTQDSASAESSTVRRETRRTAAAPAIEWTPETGWQAVTERDRERWRDAAPACDLDTELGKANAWYASQPAAKRKRDLRRFLTNWFLRAQEAAARAGGSARSTNRATGGTLPLGCYLDANGIARTASGAELWRPGDDR